MDYKLKKDDTITKIAIKYDCSENEIKLLNKVSCDSELFGKEIIKVPILDQLENEKINPVLFSDEEFTGKTMDAHEQDVFSRIDNLLKDSMDTARTLMLLLMLVSRSNSHEFQVDASNSDLLFQDDKSFLYIPLMKKKA
ncbi:hypothetical protein HZS_1654 [Henneguya salminicola]|nr:hypothetical protein HZS_1654 [Henneguya salminicola]